IKLSVKVKFELLISFDEVLLPHSQTLLVVQFSKNNLQSSASAYCLFRFRSPRLSAATHIIYHARQQYATGKKLLF
ncbi:hypothetical protein RQP50_28920, partial [Paenibacillus sp. chi10]